MRWPGWTVLAGVSVRKPSTAAGVRAVPCRLRGAIVPIRACRLPLSPWRRQGNRSKSSACAEQDSVEVMWVPCGQLAADLEALARFGGAQQVHDHVSDGGHVLRSVAGAQAG